MEGAEDTFVLFCALREGGLRTLETEILHLPCWDVWH